MRSLNRLKWLHAFEATARHGSFTGAAQELGVTPAAVGQLVRSLEDWVGHPLLHRTRSGKERLTLVDEAQEALQDITQGLDKLETGLSKLRGRRSRSVVVVTASQVLMMNWLMDRLNRFAETHENIDLRLNVTEKLMDVSYGEADIGIRCGQGEWPGVSKTWLMDEEAVLVCSPRLAPPEKMACSEWLATQKLIHDDTPHPGADFPSWGDVLRAVGAPETRESGLHINSTSAVILSALSGRGVAIVRNALVKQLIETEQLVHLHPDHRWPLRWSYYLVTPQQHVMRDEVKIFHDWLLQDVVSDRS
ncbi:MULTISPECIES: LysR substrate-binding domain-containing protein [Serratia]|jgi:LysR family glycine cleavage system transcriptional activator|uniref:LysR substrate-binding domain-containing protein n=1 Tax=Serratia TaxID=613 RepID=UPI000B60E5AF|nr:MULTISPECIES: LysR substrate-binding domain-containing protein [Serratia]ASL85848.1 LysR family transcriptional regulator [Serratia marcescens]MBH2746715.1 LysR family transcriptional regulator [Serratia marcescens]MBH2967197.1 LysR family transcriptional regulator [Serratia marcescens]MBH3231604.1 LysR family transcriptional regulator [Serratia marcescens]MBH3261862.1 LysR family transcriptional regulator [Serratia marcescens]